MATQNDTRTPKTEKLYEDGAERVREINNQLIEASRKAGSTYFDAYERTLKGIADYEAKLAELSQVEWLSTLLNAQADFTREIAKTTTASGREFLK